MNIFKSFNLNSMTLRKIEDIDKEDFFYGLFFVCVKFHGQIIIKCSTSS